MTRRPLLLASLFIALGALYPPAAPAAEPAAAASPAPSPSPAETPGPPLANKQWREIGPALPGGRVAAVEGSASDPKLYYFGAAGGGVWKSTNGGQTWNPVFQKQAVAAIGAIAIDPKNDETVWVGTGEANPRNDVSYGNGIYRTTDGGKTWTNMGLGATRHIARIRIDPQNSNHIVVAALGDVFGDSTERGIYVTQDGGRTWDKTLYLSNASGGSDLAMNPQHPNIIFAGMWHFRRQPWTFTSGGEDDGLFRSTDGGRTWTKLTGHGLPAGTTGRIGLAISQSNPSRVYATIESADGILWRSDNGGEDWTLVSKDTLVVQRPFYFSHIEVDPKNPDHVYGLSAEFSSSTDGGKTFHSIHNAPHGDFHAMWIAPNEPSRMMVGEDGGIGISVDGGQNWFFDRNVPIGQVYHVGVSRHENPYTICGGWQDNNGWCGPSNSLDSSGILNKHWIDVTGGDGEWAVPDPIDSNWIWADSQNGFLGVYNRVSKEAIFAPAYFQTGLESFDLSKSKYRFNWDTPIAFAPWDGHIGWIAGNVIFQTTDRGVHWKPISPDLTLNLKEHQQPSGGPITNDVSGAEYSDTSLDIEGSTLHRGEIWVGTDDGLVQLTLDGGKHWKNVTPAGVPPYGRVETVAPSTTHDGTIYVNIDRHKSGDFKPYLFVSHNFGTTWTSIVNNLPADQYVRAVRPDLHNGNIVYAGTENGMWISVDGGKNWQDFKNNLPPVSVRDIRFQPEMNDLVIATHGRSIYVMDDMRTVQAVAQEQQRSLLFPPRTAYEYNLHSDDEGTYTDYTGQNPPAGVVIQFYQKNKGKDGPEIQILDANRHAIRTVKGTHKVNDKDVPWVTNKYGLNTFVWDFQVDGPTKWLGAAKEPFQGPDEGPGVPPGRYFVRMALEGRTYTEPFEVKADPRELFSQRQLVESFNFFNDYNRKLGVVDTMLNSLDEIKKQLDTARADATKKNDSALGTQIDAALAARTTLFNELTANYANGEDSIQRPGKLREDVQGFGGSIITPALREIAGRVDREYATGIVHFNVYITSLGPVSAAIAAGGGKPLSGLKPVAP